MLNSFVPNGANRFKAEKWKDCYVDKITQAIIRLKVKFQTNVLTNAGRTAVPPASIMKKNDD